MTGRSRIGLVVATNLCGAGRTREALVGAGAGTNQDGAGPVGEPPRQSSRQYSHWYLHVHDNRNREPSVHANTQSNHHAWHQKACISIDSPLTAPRYTTELQNAYSQSYSLRRCRLGGEIRAGMEAQPKQLQSRPRYTRQVRPLRAGQYRGREAQWHSVPRP